MKLRRGDARHMRHESCTQMNVHTCTCASRNTHARTHAQQETYQKYPVRTSGWAAQRTGERVPRPHLRRFQAHRFQWHSNLASVLACTGGLAARRSGSAYQLCDPAALNHCEPIYFGVVIVTSTLKLEFGAHRRARSSSMWERVSAVRSCCARSRAVSSSLSAAAASFAPASTCGRTRSEQFCG